MKPNCLKMTLPRTCQPPVVKPAARCRQNRVRSNRRSGFTLLELLLVLAILVVLGGIVLVNFGGAQDEANVKTTISQLNSLKQAVQFYQIRMNSLPKSLDELKDGPSDSAKKSKWTGPIIERIPEDAWGNSINYTLKGNSYELRSGGLDGQMNTDDDIIVTN
jgi:general secretion pathway protein G